MKKKLSDLRLILEAVKGKNMSASRAVDQEDYSIELIVDYTKTLEQLIVDGKYNLVNQSITSKNFPIPDGLTGKKVKVLGNFFYFNRSVSSKNVIKKMDKAGFRPATLMELLALRVACLELKKQYSIIALGSIWKNNFGYLYVSSFAVNNDNCHLVLDPFNGNWLAACCFFGVCKQLIE
ncbi:MAG: hypothetical protein WC564_02905 [Patescibacteria group bacterium]|jgi:hypothetical protein